MPLSGDILRGKVDYLIVFVLSEGDNYGYGINQRIIELSGGEIDLTEAAMYTAFKRLENSSKVTSYWLD